MANPRTKRENTPEARYSNWFRVGQNTYESICDFGQLDSSGHEYPQRRIVSSPPHARDCYELLGAAIAEHQQRYGASRDVH